MIERSSAYCSGSGSYNLTERSNPMRRVNLIVSAVVAMYLLAALLALGRGGNPPASTKESGATSGHGMTAVEQTGEGGGSVEQEMTVLSERIGQAYMKGDFNLLEKYLTDDYRAIRANGMLYSKAEEIENFKSGALKIESDDSHERKIRTYGDMAIVDGLASVKGTRNGRPFSGDFRFTRVWVKQKGNWKSVAYQATRVASSH
jgi:ketosteroid isomerase-like protein